MHTSAATAHDDRLALQTASRLPLLPCVLLLFASAASLLVDLPVARALRSKVVPSFLKEFLNHSESFGHGVGVTLILVAVVQVDPQRLRSLPLLIGCPLCAGLFANLLKLFIVRTRPRAMSLEVDHAIATFDGWQFGFRSTELQAFPSAHTSTAVGLAVALSVFYPRAVWYFVVMAALCGLQRMNSEAHFLSDVLFGAGIGWGVSTLILRIAARRGNTAPLEEEMEATASAASRDVRLAA